VGIAIAPDGLGFYVTDWNFPGWKRNRPDVGRLFKLTWKGPGRAAPKPDWYSRPTDDPSTKQLIDGLSHPSRDVRMAAQRKLVDLESTAAVLKDPAASSIARRHALWVAASCDAARDALRSTDPLLRLQAARFLGLAGDRASAVMLASLLRDADGAMRLRAAAALGRIGDPSTIPALLAALDDEEATVRHVVASALQRIGAWGSVATGLDSDRPAVRLGTLHTLREAYDERVVERVAVAALETSAPVDFRLAATGVLRDLERKPAPWDGRWWRNGPYAWCEDDPRTAPRIDRTIEWSGSPAARQALEKLRRDSSPLVRAAAEPVAPLLPAPPPPVPPLRTVSTLGPEAYVAFAADHRGDVDRGRACFLSVCIRCHRLGGRGGELGPDMAGVGSKYARSTLIDSVLFPSRQIAEGFQQTMVRTRDGDVVAGLARGETDDELALADGEGRLHRVRKSTIEARKLSDVSLMPEGLQRAMTLQEFVDLVAFLESLQESDGFVPLFNGKDLGGWNKDPSHEAHWTVKEGGILRYDAKGKDLWTEKSYGDFVLKVDWRFPSTPVEKEAPVILPDGSVTTKMEKVMDGGDSGIFLRGSQKSQVNIWCWPIGSGEIYGYRTDPKLPPEVRAAATPKSRADLPPGQWNKFVIIMKGDRLTVVLNGTTVIDQAQLPGVPARGPIGLQHPGRPLTPEMPVEFANLLIRELP
jgi:putative heme-binding domain-containing protein